jgi:hypothetical protein
MRDDVQCYMRHAISLFRGRPILWMRRRRGKRRSGGRIDDRPHRKAALDRDRRNDGLDGNIRSLIRFHNSLDFAKSRDFCGVMAGF